MTEQSTIETVDVNFMIKKGIYSLEFIARNLEASKVVESSKKSSQNVPNAGRRVRVPNEADASQI